VFSLFTGIAAKTLQFQLENLFQPLFQAVNNRKLIAVLIINHINGLHFYYPCYA